MHFGSLVLKNLVRRPLRTGLTLLALATAIAAVVALLGISNGFTRSFAEIYTAHSVDIVVSRQGSADRLSSSIDVNFAPQIEQLPAVERAAVVLLETMSLEEEGVYGVPTMGIDPDSWLIRDYELVDQIDSLKSQIDAEVAESAASPTNAANNEGKKNEGARTLMLGVHLAERTGKSAGDSVLLFDDAYTVKGVFKSPSTWENGAMILPLGVLQELTDRAGQATYINVVLKNELGGPSPEEAIKAIEQLDAKLLPLATAEFVETDTRLQLASAMAWMTSVIAVVIGTIGTLNTMLTSVLERTKEIGILRAIGWPKRRVVRMILLESCGLAVVASLLGTVLAVLMTWALSQAPAVKGILSPTIELKVIVQGIVLALTIGILGAILPAWRAARLLPTEAFREA